MKYYIPLVILLLSLCCLYFSQRFGMFLGSSPPAPLDRQIASIETTLGSEYSELDRRPNLDDKPTCPEETYLAEKDIKISVDECRKEYKHFVKIGEQVIYQRYCFHRLSEETLAELNKGVFIGLGKKEYEFEYEPDGVGRIRLTTYHSSYTLEFIQNDGQIAEKNAWPKEDKVVELMKSANLPEKVVLYRCVCPPLLSEVETESQTEERAKNLHFERCGKRLKLF